MTGTTTGGIWILTDTTLVNINPSGDLIPGDYSLKQNYPNPFNPETVIGYSLPAAGKVTLKIYDILGKEVAELVNEEKPAGQYEVKFNASKLTSGVYLYTLKAGNYTETKKMVLIK